MCRISNRLMTCDITDVFLSVSRTFLRPEVQVRGEGIETAVLQIRKAPKLHWKIRQKSNKIREDLQTFITNETYPSSWRNNRRQESVHETVQECSTADATKRPTKSSIRLAGDWLELITNTYAVNFLTSNVKPLFRLFASGPRPVFSFFPSHRHGVAYAARADGATLGLWPRFCQTSDETAARRKNEAASAVIRWWTRSYCST